MTKVKITTTLGTMVAELYEDKAPITVANFLSYVDKGFYNETIFHRVIENFMIQGGGFTVDMSQKATDAPIKNEAMVVDSATCQFFINHKNNDFLNFRAPTMQGFGYCVFGKIVEGLDVLDAIAQVRTITHPSGHADVPAEPVIINSIERA